MKKLQIGSPVRFKYFGKVYKGFIRDFSERNVLGLQRRSCKVEAEGKKYLVEISDIIKD